MKTGKLVLISLAICAVMVVLVALALIPLDPALRRLAVLPVVLGAALVPVVYSWWLWNGKKHGA